MLASSGTDLRQEKELMMSGASSLSESERDRLISAAEDAARNAYAPYSRFQVGAAVLTSSGQIYAGCNVENASYGLTICAERVALFSAVATEGPDGFGVRAIAVATSTRAPAPPCGACRQVMAEFGLDAEVFFFDDS
jgi:cytidine deaminase